MPGNLLIIDTLLCPHGGQVSIQPANLRAAANGVPMSTMADTFQIVGCPFQIPATPPIPSPCILVQWQAADLRNSAGGLATLTQASQGICIGATGLPQGPVVVVTSQPGVQSL
jgi:hypothetical protein